MGRHSSSGMAFPLMPLLFTCVVVLEELAIYKVRQVVADPIVRAGVVMALFGVGFGIAAGVLVPQLSALLAAVRRSSEREGGAVGVLLFYVAAYAGLYYALLIMETKGVEFLLPIKWR